MIITRHEAAPNKWTFNIPPIKELLDRYVGEEEFWVDPFSGMSSLADLTNDFNPEMPSVYHMLADEFCDKLSNMYDGVLFDPPYSYRQITEAYKLRGLRASMLDTSANFYNRVMNSICDKIRPGGYAISFGWNTNGFGMHRGFYKVEIMVVAHGMHHNDTLVTVEKKGVCDVRHLL